jgi:nucleotide-binding universal stress UspA family protein
MREIKRILVATHFDTTMTAVIDAAATLARTTGASVHVLCVLEALMYATPEMAMWAERDPRTHPEVSRSLEDAVHSLRAQGVQNADAGVEYGIAVDVILRRATEGGFDLLVIGNRGHSTGVGAYLVAHAKVPVLAVPSHAH